MKTALAILLICSFWVEVPSRNAAWVPAWAKNPTISMLGDGPAYLSVTNIPSGRDCQYQFWMEIESQWCAANVSSGCFCTNPSDWSAAPVNVPASWKPPANWTAFNCK